MESGSQVAEVGTVKDDTGKMDQKGKEVEEGNNVSKVGGEEKLANSDTGNGGGKEETTGKQGESDEKQPEQDVTKITTSSTDENVTENVTVAKSDETDVKDDKEESQGQDLGTQDQQQESTLQPPDDQQRDSSSKEQQTEASSTSTTAAAAAAPAAPAIVPTTTVSTPSSAQPEPEVSEGQTHPHAPPQYQHPSQFPPPQYPIQSPYPPPPYTMGALDDVKELPTGIVEAIEHVPKEAVGFVIGKSGATIKEMMSRSGATIKVERPNFLFPQYGYSGGLNGPEEDNGTTRRFIVCGDRHAVETARGLIREKVRGRLGGDRGLAGMNSRGGYLEEMWVPAGRVGMLIGAGGSSIRMLEEESRATIVVHNERINERNEKCVTISAEAVESVKRAVQLIEEALERPRIGGSPWYEGGAAYGGYGMDERNQQPWYAASGSPAALQGGGYGPGVTVKTVMVPSSCVGMVIGKSGQTIRDLQGRSKAMIRVTKDDEAPLGAVERAIQLKGTKDAVELAHQLLNDIVNEGLKRNARDGRESIAFTEAQPAVGGLRGAPTSTTEEALPLPVTEDGRTYPSNSVSVPISIPNDRVGVIIGKRGATIRDLQYQSGARIVVSKEGDMSQDPSQMRTLTITGPRKFVDRARELIMLKVEDINMRRTFTPPFFRGPPPRGPPPPPRGPGNGHNQQLRPGGGGLLNIAPPPSPFTSYPFHSAHHQRPPPSSPQPNPNPHYYDPHPPMYAYDQYGPEVRARFAAQHQMYFQQYIQPSMLNQQQQLAAEAGSQTNAESGGQQGAPGDVNQQQQQNERTPEQQRAEEQRQYLQQSQQQTQPQQFPPPGAQYQQAPNHMRGLTQSPMMQQQPQHGMQRHYPGGPPPPPGSSIPTQQGWTGQNASERLDPIYREKPPNFQSTGAGLERTGGVPEAGSTTSLAQNQDNNGPAGLTTNENDGNSQTITTER